MLANLVEILELKCEISLAPQLATTTWYIFTDEFIPMECYMAILSIKNLLLSWKNVIIEAEKKQETIENLIMTSTLFFP